MATFSGGTTPSSDLTFGGARRFSVPGCQTSTVAGINKCSNVGIPGLFVFRVDQYDIIHPTPNITAKAGSYLNWFK